MDGSRFDSLTRSLAEPRSRRALTRLVGALTLGPPFTRLDQADAKKKRKKGKCTGKNKKKAKCKGGEDDNDTDKGQQLCADWNCKGCCENGVCQPGTDNLRCGHEGVPCEDCSAQGKVCHLQTCTGCIKEECARTNGCCLFDTQCAPGNAPEACGSGGDICTVCPPGNTCGPNRICVPEWNCGDEQCYGARPHCCSPGVCGQCCLDAHCGPGKRCHPFHDCVACLPSGAPCTTDFGCCSDNCVPSEEGGTFGNCA